MIVVADTSPLNYLLLIDAAHVVQPLFGEVIIPAAVQRGGQSRGQPTFLGSEG